MFDGVVEEVAVLRVFGDDNSTRRGRIGPVGGVEELLGLVGLLNLTFLIPMRLPMLMRETIFLIAPEGMGGVRGGWREGISPWCK
jgi:hypothetical protein